MGTMALALLTVCAIMLKKSRDDRRERCADRELFLNRIDGVFKATEDRGRENFRTLLRMIREEFQTLGNRINDVEKQVADFAARTSKHFKRADRECREDFQTLLKIVQEQGRTLASRFSDLADRLGYLERNAGKRSDHTSEAIGRLREDQHRVATRVAELSGIIQQAMRTTLPEYVAAQSVPDEDRSE